MKKIVGVRFKKPGKIYFFDPQDMVIEKNDDVIVETSMGDEIGKVYGWTFPEKTAHRSYER